MKPFVIGAIVALSLSGLAAHARGSFALTGKTDVDVHSLLGGPDSSWCVLNTEVCLERYRQGGLTVYYKVDGNKFTVVDEEVHDLTTP
jgi:hypothetical protein